MSFAAPQWWWALAAVVVPVVIHLLSRGRRQRIAIGTVRHLAGAESRALRRLRLTGWQLLLLRMATLAVLVLALVGPRLPRSREAMGAGGWVLIDPELVGADSQDSQIPHGFRTRLESAFAEARSVRVLTRGLPEHPDEESLDKKVDVWSLLREADAVAPKGVPFTVFSFDRVELLRGRRPHLTRAVDWHVVEDTEPNRWVEQVVLDAEGDLIATVGESTSEGTQFGTETWKAGGSPTSEIVRLSSTDRYPEDDVVPVPILAVPLRVALSVGEDRADDAWYIRRAVETVGRYTGRTVRWVDRGSEVADLAIGLGDSVRESASAAVVLNDYEPDYEPCQGVAYASSMLGDPRTRVSRCSTEWSSESGAAWWVDGWGRPFVYRLPDTSGAAYRLQGRFDPRWSDLVTTAALPRLLLSVLETPFSGKRGASTSRSDRRGTTGSERLPTRLESGSQPDSNPSVIPELLAWMLVALLLIAERFLSGRSS